jgi:hypothetical protein
LSLALIHSNDITSTVYWRGDLYWDSGSAFKVLGFRLTAAHQHFRGSNSTLNPER